MYSTPYCCSHAAFAALLVTSVTANAQEHPVVVRGPVSDAVYINREHKAGNDGYGYAGVHRAGDTLYVSGVIVGAPEGEPLDDDGLRDELRRAFATIERVLASAGADYGNVVDLVTFHVWDSEYYSGGKEEQLAAIVDVRREFMNEPDPAWTAVGTTELVPDRGIIEIRATAYAPGGHERARRDNTHGRSIFPKPR